MFLLLLTPALAAEVREVSYRYRVHEVVAMTRNMFVVCDSCQPTKMVRLRPGNVRISVRVREVNHARETSKKTKEDVSD